jgi:hypothetical protein
VFLILPIIGIVGDKYAYLAYYLRLAGVKRRTGLIQNIIFNKSSGKAIPLQAWSGPEGSRRLRLPQFNRVGT